MDFRRDTTMHLFLLQIRVQGKWTLAPRLLTWRTPSTNVISWPDTKLDEASSGWHQIPSDSETFQIKFNADTFRHLARNFNIAVILVVVNSCLCFTLIIFLILPFLGIYVCIYLFYIIFLCLQSRL